MALRKVLYILFVSATMGCASSEVFSADRSNPLQGNVDSVAPLQGVVGKDAPLQGAVDKLAPLNGKVDRLAPLQGSADRSAPLQGNVDRSGPLQGSVDTRGPLNGRVQGQGSAPLNSMTPSYSAIMRIVQFKDKNGEVTASPAPITQSEIEGARTRDRVNSNQVPLRGEEIERPPVRSSVENSPSSSPSNIIGRPKRNAISVPGRGEEQLKPHLEISVSAPPVRGVGDDLQRPVRGLMEPPPPPPIRVEPVTARVLTPPAAADVLVPPNSNTQIETPQTKTEVATAPQRAKQNKIREKQQKKLRTRTVDSEPTHTASTTTAPSAPPVVDEKLLWDPWYAHMNDLLCRALVHTMPKHGNPAGSNRIRITVYPDHRLEADIVQGANAQFNQALIEAYRSLNGNQELQFPAGTRRTVNTYETAHIQDIPAVTAGFDSTLVRGDVENFVK